MILAISRPLGENSDLEDRLISKNINPLEGCEKNLRCHFFHFLRGRRSLYYHQISSQLLIETFSFDSYIICLSGRADSKKFK